MPKKGKKKGDLHSALVGDDADVAASHLAGAAVGERSSFEGPIPCSDLPYAGSECVHWNVWFNGSPDQLFPATGGDGRVISPNFKIGGVSWNLLLQASEDRDLGVFLNCVDKMCLAGERKIHSAFELLAVNANPHLNEIKTLYHPFSDKAPDWGLSSLIAKKYLHNMSDGFANEHTSDDDKQFCHLRFSVAIRVLNIDESSKGGEGGGLEHINVTVKGQVPSAECFYFHFYFFYMLARPWDVCPKAIPSLFPCFLGAATRPESMAD